MRPSKYSKEQRKQYNKIYREKNRESILKKKKEYRENNKEKVAEGLKKWRNSEKGKKYYKSKKRKEYLKKWKENNKSYQLNYVISRYKTDELFKFSSNIKSLIRMTFKLKGFKKNYKTDEILGCSIIFFKSFIESKWESWMNWNNYGKYNGTLNFGWDLDHIIPLKTAKTIEDVIKLNNFTNFQPLDSYINRYIKKCNYETK